MTERQLYLFDYPFAYGAVPTRGGVREIGVWLFPGPEGVGFALEEFVRQSPATLARLESAEAVWIKPNITGAELPSQGRTTQPRVLDAVLTWLKSLVPRSRKIYVADSSVVGCDTDEAVEITGILSVCETHRVPFVDVRNLGFSNRHVPNPLEFATLPISEPFVRSEVFKINIGKVKSTYGSPVGFCIKNAKGLLPDNIKLQFHLRGVQRAICDLAEAVQWDLCILEGFPASELGVPTRNAPLFVSNDPSLIDGLACICLGVPLSEVFHVDHLLRRAGVEEEALRSLPGLASVILGCFTLAWSRTGLAALAQKYGLAVNDGDPCSGCVESLAKGLSKRKMSANDSCPSALVAGANAEGIAQFASQRTTAFLGNCSFDAVGMELVRRGYDEEVLNIWKEAVKIPGCPPTIDDIVSILDEPRPQKLPASERGPYSHRTGRAFGVQYLFASATAKKMPVLASMTPSETVSFEPLGREVAFACEVICAAICHQMNWTFLRQQLYREVTAGADWWQPSKIGSVDDCTVQRILADYNKPDRIRAVERAGMLRSLQALFAKGATSFCAALGDTLSADEQQTVLRESLDRCDVFREDPEEKKRQVLLHRLAASGLVPHVEPICRPAIDYHILRLYLRRGDVAPETKFGTEYMTDSRSRRASTVASLRRTVAAALSEIARYSRLPVHLVNTIEWWIGRSVCLRGKPDCELEGEACNWLRPRFSRCPFVDNCFALNVAPAHLLKITEPRHAGRFF